MLSLFRKSSTEETKKINESKIMTKEEFLSHVTGQIRSAKNIGTIIHLSDKNLIYIGHNDLLAVTFGKDFGTDSYLELYIPNNRHFLVEESLKKNGVIDNKISMSEYCPRGYICLAYDGLDKMSSVINALHNLKILDDSQHKESQVYCQENEKPSPTFG